MTGRQLPDGTYGYDDLAVGDWFLTGEAEIGTALIDAFADVSADRFEIHMDDAAARDYGFPRRVAHGLLVLSVVDGLKNGAGARFAAIASLGWNWSFRRPVLSGDRVRARIRIEAMRPTGKPDRGILTLAFAVTNQTGEVVQEGSNQLMVFRQTPGA